MNCVLFDSYNSYNDFGLILEDYDIASATRKTNYVSIPGRSGDLDLSDYLGVAYENREINISFTKQVDRDDFVNFRTKLETALNGNRMQVVFYNDTSYYWNARIEKIEYSRINFNYINISMTLNAHPYKVNLTSGEEVL